MSDPRNFCRSGREALAFVLVLGSVPLFALCGWWGFDRWLYAGDPASLHVDEVYEVTAVMVALIILSIPLSWQLKNEEWPLPPILKLPRAAATAMRVAKVALFLHVVVRLILAVRTKSEGALYDALLSMCVFASFLLLTCYLFGVETMFSERFLALSRHPWLLLRKNGLKRYLERRRRDAAKQKAMLRS